MNKQNTLILTIPLFTAALLFTGCYRRFDRSYSNAKKAYAYTQSGDLDKAIEYCNKSIAANPNYSYAYELRASCYNHQGSNHLALADCNTAITMLGGSSDAYYIRARTYCGLNNISNAFDDCNEAISINPNNEAAYILRSWIYETRDEMEKALSDASEAIKINPYNPESYLYRANVYANTDEFGKARADVENAINLRADPDKTDYQLSNIAEHLGDYKTAIEIIDQHLKRSPDAAWALNAKAYILCSAGDDTYRNGKEALKLAEKALKNIPPQGKNAVMDTLACAYAELGQFDKAIEIQKEVIAKRPEHKELKDHMEAFKNKKAWYEPASKNSN